MSGESRGAQLTTWLPQVVTIVVMVGTFIFAQGVEAESVRRTIDDLTEAVDGLASKVTHDVAKKQDVRHAFRIFADANPDLVIPDALFDYFDG